MNETTDTPDHEPTAPQPRVQGSEVTTVWIDEWASFVPADDMTDLDSQITRQYAQNWLDRYAPGLQLSDIGIFSKPQHRPRRRSAFAPGGNVNHTLPVLARKDGGLFSPVTDDEMAAAIGRREQADIDVKVNRELVTEAAVRVDRLQEKSERAFRKYREAKEVLEQHTADLKANEGDLADAEKRVAELDRACRTQLQVPVEPQFDPDGEVLVEYTSTTPTGRIASKHYAVRRRSGRAFVWSVTGEAGVVRWNTLLHRIQNGETDRQAALDSVKLVAYTPSQQAEGLAPVVAAKTDLRPRF
ncbi:hypothetical protein SEA_GUYFAGIERI_2 [Rhodococcus phage GuyFagieri]|nr:hypothetical protein SEA_GUYFAGIERI_2 [Rhodococcus phage GuyFagieri]